MWGLWGLNYIKSQVSLCRGFMMPSTVRQEGRSRLAQETVARQSGWWVRRFCWGLYEF
jgi:hypothetical protein